MRREESRGMDLQKAVASTQGAEKVAPGNVNGHPGDESPRAAHTLSSQTISFQLSLHSFPSVSYALINDSTNLFSTFHRSPPGPLQLCGDPQPKCDDFGVDTWPAVSGCQYQTLK